MRLCRRLDGAVRERDRAAAVLRDDGGCAIGVPSRDRNGIGSRRDVACAVDARPDRRKASERCAGFRYQFDLACGVFERNRGAVVLYGQVELSRGAKERIKAAADRSAIGGKRAEVGLL